MEEVIINMKSQIYKLKNVFLVVGLAVLLAGCNLTSGGDEVDESATDTQVEKQATAGESEESKEGDENGGAMEKDSNEGGSYTLSEVAEHDSEDDCWLAIEGKVYDVTEYAASGKHGGGDAILLGCGTDATELYNDRPNGSGAHSEKARSFLPNYEIGDVVEE